MKPLSYIELLLARTWFLGMSIGVGLSYSGIGLIAGIWNTVPLSTFRSGLNWIGSTNRIFFFLRFISFSQALDLQMVRPLLTSSMGPSSGSLLQLERSVFACLVLRS